MHKILMTSILTLGSKLMSNFLFTFVIIFPLSSFAGRTLILPTTPTSTEINTSPGTCALLIESQLFFTNLSNIRQTLTIEKTGESFQAGACGTPPPNPSVWTLHSGDCYNSSRSFQPQTYSLVLGPNQTGSLDTGIFCNVGDNLLNCTEHSNAPSHSTIVSTTLSLLAAVNHYRSNLKISIAEDRGAVIGSHLLRPTSLCVVMTGAPRQVFPLNGGRPF